jgi:hypothetical protein
MGVIVSERKPMISFKLHKYIRSRVPHTISLFSQIPPLGVVLSEKVGGADDLSKSSALQALRSNKKSIAVICLGKTFLPCIGFFYS